MWKFGVAGLVWALVVPQLAFGQVARIDEIVVEETEEVRALQERRESPVAKTVITKKEMEELGGQTAADVLRRLPRLYFSGPPGTSKDVRQAGLDKEFQNGLINGNRPPGGGEKREIALDRIPVEMIERIEVFKNPTAAHDSDAIAGIVNVIIKQPPKTRTFSATVSGSYSDQADKLGNKVTLQYGDRTGPLSYTLGGSRSDEYRGIEKTVIDAGPKNEREETVEVVRTTSVGANLSLSAQLGERDRITFKPYLTDQSEKKNKTKDLFNLTTGALKNRDIEEEDKDQLLKSYGLEWEHRFAGGSALRLQGMHSTNEEDKFKAIEKFNAALNLQRTEFEKELKEDRERVLGADYKIPLSGPWDTEHLVSLGVKLRDKDRTVRKDKWQINAATGVVTDTTSPLDSYRMEERITGYYVMDEVALTDRFILTPGVRVEVTDGEYLTADGQRGTADDTDVNPSLHALYKIGRGYQLRGSYARTIGRPPFKDKVPIRSEKKDKIELGNPDLQAAISKNYEAAIEKFFGRGGLVAIGAFYKNIDGVIEKRQIGVDPGTGLPIEMPVNAGEATVKGLDFEVRTDLGFIALPNVTLNANYTLQDSEVKDPNTGATRRMKDHPQHLANLIARYTHRPLGFGASVGVNYIGKKVDETNPLTPTKEEKAFTTLDASITQKIYGGASLFASANNILNEKREKNDGLKKEIEEVGRMFYLGVRFDL